MTFELPEEIYSPQLLEAVIYDIELYLDWYRDARVKKRVGVNAPTEPSRSAETLLAIKAWLGDDQPSVQALEELLAHLQGLKLPEVHITLAAMPNQTQRETLVNWFRSNATPHLLLSFVADRNVGGGIVVRTPNHVFDASWKQQILDGRDKITEIIRRV